MKINSAGIKLLKQLEGCKLEAYPDPATGKDPWTIGYGATGDSIVQGTIWTQPEADDRLARDLNRVATEVTLYLKTQISSNQFTALVIFTYNVGLKNLISSTLLKKVNQNDFQSAANEFDKWNHANGKILPGLILRRQAEK